MQDRTRRNQARPMVSPVQRATMQYEMRRSRHPVTSKNRLKLTSRLQSLHCRGERQTRVYTASRLRPLARRALMTARPPRVFMRTRKPWVRARRILEGW